MPEAPRIPMGRTPAMPMPMLLVLLSFLFATAVGLAVPGTTGGSPAWGPAFPRAFLPGRASCSHRGGRSRGGSLPFPREPARRLRNGTGIRSAQGTGVGDRSARPDDDAHGGRFVVLLEDYGSAAGPYFYALFDQMHEQCLAGQPETAPRVLVCTTRRDLEELAGEPSGGKNTNGGGDDNGGPDVAARRWLEDLRSSLALENDPELFVLDDWNPWLLEQRFSPARERESGRESPDQGATAGNAESPSDSDPPTVVWLRGTSNAFATRHLLRTSGFDALLRAWCGPGAGEPCTLLVGEGTGAACAGETMAAARVRGDDPSGAPELQASGLGLVGDAAAEAAVSTGRNDPGACLVWAQVPAGGRAPREEAPTDASAATSFVFRPAQRGSIEGYDPEREPLPPLAAPDGEGVACTGEPSVDPSRAAQAGGIGDSEWWE